MTNLKIFNAPAGSGKSTEIKDRVREWSSRFPQDRMLCVTYTNRAAEELKTGISAENVDVLTIHSFLAEFMIPVFASPEAVSLYLKVYKDDIEARLANGEKKTHIETSNAGYREKLGEPLTFELIANSIKSLRYNEMQFNSLFEGGLSHDDLLSFTAVCAAHFPGLRKRISSKYQQIIIDEYQDTSVEVLEFFVDAVGASTSSLHLYGDPMQQIYQVSSSRLRSVLGRFKVDDRTVTNYRSSTAIVDSLNKIYNDPRVKQEASNEASSLPPRVHITDAPQELRKELAQPETLVLSVRNATIFENIGAAELLKAVQSMTEHGYSSRYPAVTVLKESRWLEVNSPLIQLLFGLLHLEDIYRQGKYGEVIQILKKHSLVFGFRPIESHDDKIRLREELEALFSFLRSDEISIQEVVSHLVSFEYMKPSAAGEYLENEDYVALLGVSFSQVRKMHVFNQRPRWSTQHGVKGESHEKVIFLAEDSATTPSVHVNKLFNLWPIVPFSLAALEEAYVEILALFEQARENAAGYFTKPNKAAYEEHAHVVTAEARSVMDACTHQPLFALLYGELFENYFSKQNTSSASRLFKISALEGLISAYRLFYVGCSRAKEQLDVIVDREKIDDAQTLSLKFENLGFEVVPH